VKMSCMPKDTCTECRQTHRAVDVHSFFECNKHRLCKECIRKQPPVRGQQNSDKCPICDLSRRRLGVVVRSDLEAEARVKVQCKVCNAYATGQNMKCGHGYCTPCLRTLPRTALSRNLDGSMKKACPDCEKKAAREHREELRYAMEQAEDSARLARDARESKERVEDVRLLREFRAKPRKRQAPKAPEAAGAPSAIPKPVVKVAPRATATVSAAAPAPSAAAAASRKVSFNPIVEQRAITPLSRPSSRRSLPPTIAGSGHPGPMSSTPSWLHKDHTEEPKSPVEKLRTFSRHWGVNSP